MGTHTSRCRGDVAYQLRYVGMDGFFAKCFLGANARLNKLKQIHRFIEPVVFDHDDAVFLRMIQGVRIDVGGTNQFEFVAHIVVLDFDQYQIDSAGIQSRNVFREYIP